MDTLESRCLDAFPTWLRSLAEDARALASVLEAGASEIAERGSAVALNYLFKSLDLIPDGLEDLGFMDDAFVARAAAHAVQLADPDALAVDATGTLSRLAQDAALIAEFLGAEYGRLSTYVAALDQSSARGRTVSAILADPTVRADFASEVRQWADGFATPSFKRDARNLVKLKSFLLAKLPA
jgi:uncharacterized membrane protein YkvA (DUF1232 family)